MRGGYVSGDGACGDVRITFPQRIDGVIDVNGEFGEGEVLLDIVKRAEAYKAKE